MKKLTVSTNFTIFIHFPGIAMLAAFYSRDWL